MHYRPQSADTDEATDRYLFEKLRTLPAWRKAEMLSASTRAAWELSLAGLRQRYPTATEAELHKRFSALALGREAAMRLFDWDPEREGW